MQQGHHRLAGDLGVAVGHRHRRLLVQAGQELGHPVAAVVDDRLLQSLEARSAVRRAVLDVEGPQHVHHVVRARTLHDVGVDRPRRGRQLRLARELRLGRRRRRRWRRGRRLRMDRPVRQGGRAGRGADRGALQETAPVYGSGLRRHCALLLHGSVSCGAPPPGGRPRSGRTAGLLRPPCRVPGAPGSLGRRTVRDPATLVRVDRARPCIADSFPAIVR